MSGLALANSLARLARGATGGAKKKAPLEGMSGAFKGRLAEAGDPSKRSQGGGAAAIR